MAASVISTSPSSVVDPSVRTAITTMPAAATMLATNWNSRGRSPERAIAMPMVKNTCDWITSEASPGEMSRCMAMNSKPNCPTPISTP